MNEDAATTDRPAGAGRLAENLLYFARALRRAGLPVGTGAVLEAVLACEAAGVGGREDMRATLRAIFVKRREHAILFDQMFAIFWRRRGFLEKLIGLMTPTLATAQAPQAPAPGAARVNEALFENLKSQPVEAQSETDARRSSSEKEIFNRKDFAQMSADEIAHAQDLIARLRLASDAIMTRRWTLDLAGPALDMRASLRRTLRSGGGSIELAHRSRRLRPPSIVALCDISGSMSEYTRVFLHFLHALTDRRKKTQSFLFGTRLTNVTRALRARDPDDALARIATEARDWSGGTRIAASLHNFNRDWSRRVLGQGAVVLLFTDGLERDPGAGLAHEMQRLHTSCRRLIWLNPLLRFERFEPRAQGILTMLPYVDEFRPIHDLASMEELCRVLNRPAARGAGRLSALPYGDGARANRLTQPADPHV